METICLEGAWRVCLASIDLEKESLITLEAFKEEIHLPGTTETRGLKGNKKPYEGTLHLGRKNGYEGKAYYAKEITLTKQMGKGFMLFLERTKYTRIYIDGRLKSSSHDTLTPQKHHITGIQAGRHVLVIEVDNMLGGKEDFPTGLLDGHQYTEHTQTNWNGILGALFIQPRSCASIESVVLNKAKSPQLTGTLCLASEQKRRYRLRMTLSTSQTVVFEEIILLEKGSSTTEFCVDLQAAALWDEFSPNHSIVTITLMEIETDTILDQKESAFGFTLLETREKHLYLNNARIFLRGTVDCAIFPLTGHAPTTFEAWKALFEKMKDYGLNHYRYHSWCPQEAAFEAADACGMYLQVELAGFGTSFYTEEHPKYDAILAAYYEEQAAKVLTTYGNHPSFAIFSVGNELNGEVAAYEQLLKKLKQIRSDILYTQGTNNFFEEPVCTKEDQLWITMRTGVGRNIRASFAHADLPLGFTQTKEEVGTQVEYSQALKASNIPVISHETGQFQIMPNLEEEQKYTGVLQSNTLPLYRKDLEEKGLLPLAKDFFTASGKLSAQLYKEEIESSLRTAEMSGFQLLGLQDFPGQGTALVGMLDSFLESKGIISPEEWRNFCAPQVLLAKFPTYVYEEGQPIPIEVLLYQYGACALQGEIQVSLQNEKETIEKSVISTKGYSKGTLHQAGNISFVAPSFSKGERLTLTLKMGELKNSYPLWVYPKAVPYEEREGVRILNHLSEEDEIWMEEGGSVLLLNDDARPFVEGFYPTDFWCYPMFKEGCLRKELPLAPGTMGLLIQNEHPIFNLFPTESYAEWQWQKIIANSKSYVLPPKIEPIVRVIDNFSRNQSLGFLWEEKRGKGRLIVCGADLIAMQDHPAANALLKSILRYLTIE